MKLKNKKLRLWKKNKATRSTFDRKNYNQCKNELRSLSRKLRRDFEIYLSKGMKKKPKLFWSYAKSRLKTGNKLHH